MTEISEMSLEDSEKKSSLLPSSTIRKSHGGNADTHLFTDGEIVITNRSKEGKKAQRKSRIFSNSLSKALLPSCPLFTAFPGTCRGTRVMVKEPKEGVREEISVIAKSLRLKVYL